MGPTLFLLLSLCVCFRRRTTAMKRDYDHLFKLVLIGDSGAGKSCLLLRFADDSFTDSYITSAYYRGADGIILVYDITDKESFNHVDDWLNEVNRYVNESTCKILIGNKCDNVGERQVSTEEGKKKAEEIDVAFIEASAKDATNVEAAFTMMSAELIAKREQSGPQQKKPTNGVGLLQPKNPRGAASTPAGCCAGGG